MDYTPEYVVVKNMFNKHPCKVLSRYVQEGGLVYFRVETPWTKYGCQDVYNVWEDNCIDVKKLPPAEKPALPNPLTQEAQRYKERRDANLRSVFSLERPPEEVSRPVVSIQVGGVIAGRLSEWKPDTRNPCSDLSESFVARYKERLAEEAAKTARKPMLNATIDGHLRYEDGDVLCLTDEE